MLAVGPGYVWAALFALGGIAIPLFDISGYQAVGLLCTVMDLLILVTGAIMFVRFLRKYPAEPLEIEEAPNAT
jgi:hypothetical protein